MLSILLRKALGLYTVEAVRLRLLLPEAFFARRVGELL